MITNYSDDHNFSNNKFKFVDLIVRLEKLSSASASASDQIDLTQSFMYIVYVCSYSYINKFSYSI